MTRTTLILASLLAIWASPIFGQIVVTSRPVVTYYSPAAPVVTNSPVFASPIVQYGRPVTTYYGPAVTAAPVSTYYAPAGYVVPTTSYYAPVTTYYGGPVVTPVFGRRVFVGRPLYLP
jgi:hypothetical protein